MTSLTIEQDNVQEVKGVKEMEKNYFQELAKVDVSNYIEKKNGFSYLSWAFAVDQLKRKHPDAIINVKRFPDPDMGGLPVPFMKTSLGVFVEVEVIIDGVSVSEPFPVLDFRNKPIEKPNAMDINKALQRAKVKAIAGHGLGLYIYAGEDLPILDDEDMQQPQYQNNQAPQQPQADLFTDVQKQTMRALASEIAALTEVPLAGVAQRYGMTGNMTTGQADAVINAMQLEIKAFHDKRMAATNQMQQSAVSPEVATAESLFG